MVGAQKFAVITLKDLGCLVTSTVRRENDKLPHRETLKMK